MSRYRDNLVKRHAELKNSSGDVLLTRKLASEKFLSSPNSESVERLTKSAMQDLDPAAQSESDRYWAEVDVAFEKFLKLEKQHDLLRRLTALLKEMRGTMTKTQHDSFQRRIDALSKEAS